MKKIAALILTLIILLSFTGCSNGRFLNDKEILKDVTNPTGKIYLKVYNEELDKVVVAERVYEFELFYYKAPNTVTNFISLINSGYYTDKSFERNDAFVTFGEYKFVNETDDDGVLTKTKEKVEKKYKIVGEFTNNKWTKNDETAGSGSLVMGRETDTEDPKSKYNTAYADFKILTIVNKTRIEYEKDYCVFGKITKLPDGTKFSEAGLTQQLLDYFFKTDYSTEYSLSNPVKFMITKIEIDTKGVTYPAPLTIKI